MEVAHTVRVADHVQSVMAIVTATLTAKEASGVSSETETTPAQTTAQGP